MAVKLYSFRIDEAELTDIKKLAKLHSISVTDLIKNAVERYMDELKNDSYYRLTEDIKDADADEAEEILSEIDKMSEDDMTIVSTKHVSV